MTRPVTGAEATDLFWTLARRSDRLEHVHATQEQGRIRLTLFIETSSQSSADKVARSVCRRVLSTASELEGWQLLDP